MILAQAAKSTGGSPMLTYVMFAVIIAAFYFFIMRPQSKRRREQMQMQSSLEPGARILTTNGMYATVVEIDDDGIVLEIAPGVEARFVKQAVMQVLKDDEDLGEEADEAGETVGAEDETAEGDLDAADATDSAEPAAPPAGEAPKGSAGADPLKKTTDQVGEQTSEKPSA